MQIAATPAVFKVQAQGIPAVVTPVSVATALAAVKANANTTNLVISDSAANIGSNFDALSKLGTKLKSLAVNAGATQISLTSAQFASSAPTLAKLTSAYTLKVTNVGADQVATTLGNTKVTQIEVLDSSANISANFEKLLNQPNKITKVVQTGTPENISLTGDQFTRGTAMLAKIWGNDNNVSTLGKYSLALKDVYVSNLSTAVANSKVASIAVKDTSTAISTNLALVSPGLAQAKVASITQSDISGSIAITDAKMQDASLTATLAKLSGTTTLNVSGVTAARASTVNAISQVKSFSVTDTAANVYAARTGIAASSKTSTVNIQDTAANIATNFANIAGLQGISKVKLTDSANISITATQLANSASFLAKIHGSNDVKGNYRLAVTGVLASKAAETAKLTTVADINITDTVANGLTNLTALKASKVSKIELTGTGSTIAAGLDKLDELGSKLDSVTNSDTANLSISYEQYTKRSATLGKVAGGSLVVSGVSSSVAKTVIDSDTRVSTLKVKDTAAKIASNFTSLKDLLTAAKLTMVQLSDTAAIKLTQAQYDLAKGASGLLSKVKDAVSESTNNFKLQITDALASTITALTAGTADSSFLNKVEKVSILDTSGNISANLTALNTAQNNGKLGNIIQSGTAAAIGISKSDYDAMTGVLGKIYGTNGITLGAYTLDVTGVTAAGASALLASDTKITKISVDDSAANFSSKLAELNGITASKVKALTVNDYQTNSIDVEAGVLSNYSALLGKVTSGNYKLNVLNVTASQAKVLTDGNAKINTFTVIDTGSAVAGKLADLNTLATSNKLTKITLSDLSTAIVLTNTQYNDNGASALGKIDGDYKLAISGVTVADAANLSSVINGDAHVVSYSVKDTGANIVADLTALDALGGKLQSINWTNNDIAGGDSPLALTGTQYQSYFGTLSKINGGVYDAEITDLAADDTAAAEADTNISDYKVKDTAANLAKNLTSLQASATAGTVKMSEIDRSDSATVDMTKTEYDASTAALTLMAAKSITWTVSDVAAADVATVIGDAQVASITVNDTAAHLVAKLGDTLAPGDLDANAAKITSIVVNDNGVLALTSSDQYVANKVSGGILDRLSQNTDGYHATIADLAAAKVAEATADTNIDSFTVKAEAADLGTNFADMVAAGSKLGTITQDTTNNTDPISIALADLVANAGGYVSTLQKFTVMPAIQLT